MLCGLLFNLPPDDGDYSRNSQQRNGLNFVPGVEPQRQPVAFRFEHQQFKLLQQLFLLQLPPCRNFIS